VDDEPDVGGGDVDERDEEEEADVDLRFRGGVWKRECCDEEEEGGRESFREGCGGVIGAGCVSGALARGESVIAGASLLLAVPALVAELFTWLGMLIMGALICCCCC
jgi:hypothetical protein